MKNRVASKGFSGRGLGSLGLNYIFVYVALNRLLRQTRNDFETIKLTFISYILEAPKTKAQTSKKRKLLRLDNKTSKKKKNAFNHHQEGIYKAHNTLEATNNGL